MRRSESPVTLIFSGDPSHARPAWQNITVALGIVLAFFLAIAPTLSIVQFSNGSENLNAETVLEMRRGGPWLIPQLNGGLRLIKPPATAWFTATFVSPETVASLSNADPIARDVAYRQLIWEMRSPALLTACLTLALTFEMGRLLVNFRAGVMAALIAGSTLMFLRFGRLATLDTQLGFWVALANVFLLHAVLRGRWWIGCIGAGVAIGIAFMSKGPVALAQTVAPFAALAIAIPLIRRYRPHMSSVEHEMPNEVRPDNHLRNRVFAIVAGAMLFTAVALPWFINIWLMKPDIMDAWRREVTRVGATNLEPDPWYNYVSGSLGMLPWYAFFVVGLLMTAQQAWRGERRAVMLFVLTVFPVFIMSFFQDKPIRYLQPMLAPAAVMTAVALTGQFKRWRDRASIDQWLAGIHMGLILAFVIGLPLVGHLYLKSVDGTPWYDLRMAMTVVIVGVIGWTAFVFASRRWGEAIAIGTAILVVGLQPIVALGYAKSPGGRSEMKPIADYLWANGIRNAVIYQGDRTRPPPMDIFIYSNRLFPVVKTLDEVTVPASPRIVLLLRVGEDLEANVGVPWRVLRRWDIDETHRWYAITMDPDIPADLPATVEPAVQHP